MIILHRARPVRRTSSPSVSRLVGFDGLEVRRTTSCLSRTTDF
jgi:hypothetical protein